MMDQVAVDPPVTINKWMDENKAKCNTGRRQYRLKIIFLKQIIRLLSIIQYLPTGRKYDQEWVPRYCGHVHR